MMKGEFEERLGCGVSESDYKEIEYVYTWHPGISETEGKEQIAAIFKGGGMLMIRSMREAAEMAEKLDPEIRAAHRMSENLRTRIRRLAEGDTSLENCIRETRRTINAPLSPEQKEEQFVSLMEEYGVTGVADAKMCLGLV